jgi:hypothetical protein
MRLLRGVWCVLRLLRLPHSQLVLENLALLDRGAEIALKLGDPAKAFGIKAFHAGPLISIREDAWQVRAARLPRDVAALPRCRCQDPKSSF